MKLWCRLSLSRLPSSRAALSIALCLHSLIRVIGPAAVDWPLVRKDGLEPNLLLHLLLWRKLPLLRRSLFLLIPNPLLLLRLSQKLSPLM